jgi:hypothetical protein
VLFDQPVVLERAQEAVHGAFGEAEPVRELAHSEPAGAGRQRFENPDRSVDGLDHLYGCRESLTLNSIAEYRSTL